MDEKFELNELTDDQIIILYCDLVGVLAERPYLLDIIREKLDSLKIEEEE